MTGQQFLFKVLLLHFISGNLGVDLQGTNISILDTTKSVSHEQLMCNGSIGIQSAKLSLLVNLSLVVLISDQALFTCLCLITSQYVYTRLHLSTLRYNENSKTK